MKNISDKPENIVRYQAKSVIFKENEFTKDVYILKSGRVKLFKKIGNRNMLLSVVEGGGIFGELSIIDGGARSATAVALEDCEAVKITPAEFKEGLKNIPDWFLSITRVLAQRIRLTDNRLSLSGPTVNEANICAILIYLFNGAEDQNGLNLEEVENTLIELLHIPQTELQESLDSLVKKKLVAMDQGLIKTESISQLEKHLDRLRQSFASSVII